MMQSFTVYVPTIGSWIELIYLAKTGRGCRWHRHCSCAQFSVVLCSCAQCCAQFCSVVRSVVRNYVQLCAVLCTIMFSCAQCCALCYVNRETRRPVPIRSSSPICYVSSLASGDYTIRTVVEQVSTFNH